MAIHENGVGISFKRSNGDLIWVHRDDWAEVIQDIKLIRGEEYLAALESELKGGAPSPTAPTSEPTLTAPQVVEALSTPGTPGTTLESCPRCGALKNKLVPAGFSQRTQKPYPAFYVCPTNGCPGR